MNQGEVTSIQGRVKAARFSDDRAAVIDEVAARRLYMTADQLGQILSVFAFQDERLHTVEILAPFTVDGADHFTDATKNISFASERTKINDILKAKAFNAHH
jgi:hypothetical protein